MPDCCCCAMPGGTAGGIFGGHDASGAGGKAAWLDVIGRCGRGGGVPPAPDTCMAARFAVGAGRGHADGAGALPCGGSWCWYWLCCCVCWCCGGGGCIPLGAHCCRFASGAPPAPGGLCWKGSAPVGAAEFAIDVASHCRLFVLPTVASLPKPGARPPWAGGGAESCIPMCCWCCC